MKIIKRKTLLTLLIGLLTLFALPIVSEAATQTLKSNKLTSISLTSTTGTKYAYVMPAKGYFYVQIKALDYNNPYFPKVRLIVKNKAYEEYILMRNGSWTTKKYSFAKGTKVTLAFDGVDENTVANLQVKVVAKKPTYFETENNNSKKKADTLKINKKYSGLLLANDTDWFVFKASKSGKYRLNVSLTDADGYWNDYSKTSIKVTVYKGTKQIAQKEVWNYAGWVKQFSGKLKKGEKLYIRITRTDGNGSTGVNNNYHIKVKKS